MVRIEGTYTCVKDQSFVDFLINLGVDSTLARKLLHTHWSMRIWRDHEVWGASFMCKEYPHLNSLDTMMEGKEELVSHYMFGGRARLTFKMNSTGDGFHTVCESERFGRMLWDEKYCEEGCTFTLTGKGKTLCETWERLSRTEGAYIYERGENVDAYFKACGESELIKYLHVYKIHVGRKGSTMFLSEYFGFRGYYPNTLELDMETPLYQPGDKKGETPSTKCIMSKTGVGKYMMVCRDHDGLIEEWKFTFSDWGLVLHCTEKRTGQTCKMYMKRFRDTSGTFKLVSMSGFEKFAKAMGVSAESTKEIMEDQHTKLVIMDRGNGYIRHQLIRKKHPMDFCFKLNEQFTYYHPLLKEVVKCVCTVNRYTFCMISKTSKGPLKSVMHFNDHFLTWSVSLPECHVSTKMIFEWV